MLTDLAFTLQGLLTCRLGDRGECFWLQKVALLGESELSDGLDMTDLISRHLRLISSPTTPNGVTAEPYELTVVARAS